MKKTANVEDHLLATHISNNPDFASACERGDARAIMQIVAYEMEKHNLHTKGANKLRDDILKMLLGKERLSSYAGNEILFFVWNSRLSGIGLSVLS